MNPWHKYPLVRIALPFAVGIILAIHLPAATSDLLIGVGALTVGLLLLSLIFHRKIRYGTRHFYGIVIFLILLSTGFLWQNVYTRYQTHNHFSDYPEHPELMSGVIVQEPEEKARSYKTIVRIQQLHTDSTSREVKGRLLVYLSKDSLSRTLKYGDRILFSGYLNPIESPKNPETFDYKNYMSLRYIYHQLYIPSGSLKILEEKQGNAIKMFSVNSRRTLASILKDYNLGGDDYALATALVLGYDRYLDDDLRKAYSGAGAMHVLCVSGLHVGIMYVVIAFLLNRIPIKSRWYIVVKVLLALLVIWLYALITGLEPAVTRASTMFSFVALGKLFRRKSRIYNTLAASALVMLLIDPNQIAYVGFQMSFLAVTGIVWLQPMIYNWWRPKNFLLDKAWGLVAVSLAAQLILFPLLVYYFHKVSLIFIVTNIIAIPLATLIIYNTLALFAFAGISLVGNVLSATLAGLIKGLNYSVKFLSDLPGAYLESLWISQPQMILLYLTLIVMVFCFLYAQRKVFITAMSFLIIILGSFLMKRHDTLVQNKFILYHAREGLAMDFIKGKENVFVGDSAVLNNPDLINYNFRNIWEKYRLQTTKMELGEGNSEYTDNGVKVRFPFIDFNGKTYMIFDGEYLPQNFKIYCDYLILTGKPWIDEQWIQHHIGQLNLVLFDGTNPEWYVDKVRPHFENAGIRSYATLHSGAFVEPY